MPYYFALAPNYDFTFNPLYMSRQGILWQGEWRHRLENGQYYIKLAGIDQNPNDLPSTIVDPRQLRRLPRQHRDQGALHARELVALRLGRHGRNRRHLPPLLQARQHSSDRRGRQSVPQRHFRAQLLLSRGRCLHQPAVHRPHVEVAQANKSYAYPILDYNYVMADPWLGGELRWNTNALSFSADQNPTTFAPFVERHQADEPRSSPRLTGASASSTRSASPIRPSRSFAAISYSSATSSIRRIPRARTQNTSLARGLALAGVTISYPWVANASYGSHVIEPIGQIIARQATIEQNGTARRGRQEPRLRRHEPVRLEQVLRLRPHRDRHTRQRRLAVHVPGQLRRLLRASSRARASNSPAPTPTQNPGLDANGNPVFTPDSGLQTDRSDYVLGAYLQPFTALQLISQSRFNEASFALEREDAGAQTDRRSLHGDRTIYSYLIVRSGEWDPYPSAGDLRLDRRQAHRPLERCGRRYL